MICVICGLEFESYRNRKNQKCCSKECHKIHKKEYKKEYYKENKEENKEKSKEYRQENKEKSKEYQKEYRQDNKEQRKEYDKEYYQDNKEEIKENQKEYSQTPKGKEGIKRANAKRKKTRKNFKFNPLNEWFENSNAHHINDIDVIYIPKKLHVSYAGHSVLRNRNMEPINTVAYFFLTMQNIDQLMDRKL